MYGWCITGVLLLCGCKLRTNPLAGRLDAVKVIVTLTLTVPLDSERIWQMPDLITDERLGEMVTKLWSDFTRGLILWSEFNLEMMEIMVDSRGYDVQG